MYSTGKGVLTFWIWFRRVGMTMIKKNAQYKRITIPVAIITLSVPIDIILKTEYYILLAYCVICIYFTQTEYLFSCT